ncbi:MAG: 1,4-beta-xylanase, partial [Butyrivibrio sp.]|nr:1,4-beta-xylanase [Butyrivibrio sp.]
ADSEFDLGKSLKRHGSVLEITDEEAKLLKNSAIA